MMNRIFDICCQIVAELSRLFGCTYHEMNTYIFLWLQPILVILSSLLLMYVAIKACYIKVSFIRIVLVIGITIYTIAGISAFIFLWNHYDMTAHETGQKAIEDMMHLSVSTGVSYEWINYIFFVFGMPGLILLNCFFAWLISRRNRRSKREQISTN